MRLNSGEDNDSIRAGPSSSASSSSADASTTIATNGHLTIGTNGNGFTTTKGLLGPGSATNGTSSSSSSIPRVILPGTQLYDDSSLINRQEFVRFVVQALRDVGYMESAKTLEAESGYQLESSRVAQFRRFILDGEWDDAENALEALGVHDQDALWDAKFLINRQRYLELLEARRTQDALHVLRHALVRFAPPDTDPDHIHALSSLVMCTDPEEVRRKAHWDGAEGSSRQNLLQGLQRYISPSVMLPPRRLAALLDQARQYQHSRCLFHNAPDSDFNLYQDHVCGIHHFPRDTTTILDAHAEEVWAIAWSHNGKFLASGGKDKNAIIWQLGDDPDPATREWNIAQVLRDHDHPVMHLAWSTDDSILVTGADHAIKVWNVKTGMCVQSIAMHKDEVSGLGFLPNGTGFISTSPDRHIYHWNNEGLLVDAWDPAPMRITDMAITPDGAKLVTIGMQFNTNVRPASGPAAVPINPPVQQKQPPTRMIVFDMRTKEIVNDVDFEGEVTSVKISRDSKFALLNHAPHEVRLYDLEHNRHSTKLLGPVQGENIIRGCFGGLNDNFVASGSEDGNVFIWHWKTESLIEVLPGHGSGSVNVVSWNPQNERMFATCSDDHTIRIWEALPPDPPSSPTTAMLPPPVPDPLPVPIPAPSAERDGKGKGKTNHEWDVDGVARRRTLSQSPARS
ncbi:WD40-repeat-containing domain protein [Flagelloscypha sp. PMI_526]|nr:WD40-repeat-containing domain protein [Flagelloscypha sp. PMI_526]